MIKLGETQELEIIRETSVGVYLNDSEEPSDEDVLLPRNQVPHQAEIGEQIEVFIYRDSSDRLIATRKQPKIKLGEFRLLKVLESTKIGAFLDWGLEKDLLLPFKEQVGRPRKGQDVLVYLYVDKSGRLCATMRISALLNSDSPYKQDDIVKGMIYSVRRDYGVFIAVDNKYLGLIPKHEVFGKYIIGNVIETRVTKVLEDGKLVLSAKKKAYMQMGDDAEFIRQKLVENYGFIKLNDKSSPEDIKQKLQMSKNAFKRAVGSLLKAGDLVITERGIRLLDDEDKKRMQESKDSE